MWLASQRASCCGHLFRSFRRHFLLRLSFFSCSAGRGGARPATAEPIHFMVDYLRCSCGFTETEARAASKHYAHLKSPENKRPDAVLRLLMQVGLGNADIKRVVKSLPLLLLADPKRTLEPKIRALQAAGFSGPEVAQVISINPRILFRRDVVTCIEFWRNLLGTNQYVLKTMRKDCRLLTHNLDKKVAQGLSLLRTLGIPDHKMGSLVRERPWLVSANPDKVRAFVEQVKSLGFSPGTGKFKDALCSICNFTRCSLDAKFELLRSFGWTEAGVHSVVWKFPAILRYSPKKLREVMYFLLNEVECDLSYIARNPTLVGYSMEKRLKPRFHVLKSLKAEGIPAGRNDFMSAMCIAEDTFAQKYIIPYKDRLPKLLETHHAASAEVCKS
ncbi:hypothetical protein Taro_021513 [Colocasia esculenta]|uniref:Uncharacterized protein n=1 Tax=Colocasia esculenta TaxID=4460 RepID=A0A843V586_COLES|nr:hypothetical protein [Colocasia esculenta]